MNYLISWVKVKLKQLSQIMRCQAQQLRPRRNLKAFFLTEKKKYHGIFFKHRILRDFIFPFQSLQIYRLGWKIGKVN